jgi:hypothetical protein
LPLSRMTRRVTAAWNPLPATGCQVDCGLDDTSRLPFSVDAISLIPLIQWTLPRCSIRARA